MKTMINIKSDVEIKKNAQKVAKELGLPLGTIINQYLKQFIRDKRVLFSAPLIPNKKTQRLLERIKKDIERGNNVSKPFSNVNEMDAHLQSL